jgi:hypothetical protein
MLKAIYQLSSQFIATQYGLVLKVKTKNENAKNIVETLLKELYDIDALTHIEKEKKLKKEDFYVIEVYQKTSILLNELHILESRSNPQYQLRKDLNEDDERVGYIKGAFLFNGSVNDPESNNYHLEIQTFNDHLANNLKDLLSMYYISLRVSKNRRGFFTYLKSAEQISDFIKILDVSDSLFYFENIRIERDLFNSINRVMNCEISNQKRAISAARRQIEEINYIESQNYTLKKGFKDVIKLRKEYPEDSLSELSDKSNDFIGKYYSRSVINHKLRELHVIYLTLLDK